MSDPDVRIEPMEHEDDPYWAAMRRIEAAVHSHGWDIPPSLFSIHEVPGAGLVCSTHQMPGIFYDDPQQFLGVVARIVQGNPESVAPLRLLLKPGLAGLDKLPLTLKALALVCEAWYLKGTWEDAEFLASGRSLEEHPNRVECRLVFLIGADGIFRTLNRTRVPDGEDEQIEEVEESAEVLPVGHISSAMKEIMLSLQLEEATR